MFQRCWGRAIACVTLLGFALGSADSARAENVADQVKRHVRLLNSRELTQREAAEKSLVELGPEALPFLPATNDRMPAETVDRLVRVRQALMRQGVEDSAKATLVTLSAQQMPLDKALESISKQTGNQVIDHRQEQGERASGVRLSFDIVKKPFWQALDGLLDDTGLSIYNYGRDRALYVVNRPAGQAPRGALVSYSGPFRVAPARFEAMSDLQNPANRSLKLFLEVAWEPRLHPINLVQPLAAVQAVGSDGDVSLVGGQGEPELNPGSESSAVEIPVVFALPPRKVSAIATLKGRIKAMVPGPAEEFRFTELPIAKAGIDAKRVEQRKAAVTVFIDRVRKNNDAWELEMRAKFEEPADSLESHRGWVFENEAYLEDAKGDRVTPSSYEQTREGRDEIGFKYLFDVPEGLAGRTFVYKTPLAILELPIEYEFHDLPLP